MAAKDVPLQFAQVTQPDGQQIRIAHRRYGPAAGVPLLLHIHYRANHVFWDPLLVRGLAARRPVVVFDQPGTGRSGGRVAADYQGWADNVLLLASALGLQQFDLAGFSMGGRAVQLVALTAPERVRRLVLLGTDASAAVSGSSSALSAELPAQEAPAEPIRRLTPAQTVAEFKDAITYSFFYDTPAGHAAADAYWARITAAADDLDELMPLAKEPTRRQLQAAREWSNPEGRSGRSLEELHRLPMPVLVCNGDDDLLIPSVRSWQLMKAVNRSDSGRAKLVIWPRAGHGFLWQYADDVANTINDFLDNGNGDEGRSKTAQALHL